MWWRRSLALAWLLLAGLSAPAVAAITVDGTPTEASAPSSSTATWAHTVAGTDRLLIVSVGIWDNTPAITTVQGVTYNSVALARVTGLTPPSTADAGLVDLWFLLAPDTGTHNVVVTLNATQEVFFTAAVSFNGAHQTTPFGTPATATGTATTVSVNVSSAAGELVYDSLKAFRASATGMTAGAGQTEQHDQGSGDLLAGSTEAGAATVTMSWTFTDGTGGPFWAIAAVPIKPAAAAAAAPQRALLGVGQ